MSKPRLGRAGAVTRLLVARDATDGNFNAQAKNAQNILRYWRSPTCRPSILAFGDPNPGVRENSNVDILRPRRGTLWRLDFLGAYLGRVDAIFYPGMHYWLDWAALLMRRWSGRKVPIITTIEGLQSEIGNTGREALYSKLAGHKVYCQAISRAHLRRNDMIFRMADHIIAISPFLARLAEARFGPKVSMIPLGVDDAYFRSRAPKIRQRLRVLAAGSVNERKRPDVFLSLAQHFVEVDFCWFGEGPLRAAMIAAAADAGLANLSFPGGQPPERLASEFADADILVLPSLAEGVPKVTQEAAASGLAQIIFGFYEAPSVIDGKNGFVVWNDDELVSRLKQLIADDSLRLAMGDTGRRMAAQWSWEVVAAQWERRILEICESDE